MNHPGLFKNYYPLRGRDWLRTIPEEDRLVFSRLGLAASDYGRAGGLALLHKHRAQNDQGKNRHFSNIGKRGALVTNTRRYFARRIQEESSNESN